MTFTRRDYRLVADGFPEVSVLEILRTRRYVDLETAGREIDIAPRDLRFYELRRVASRRKNRDKLERAFGRPWSQLRRVAPRMGIPA